MLNEELRAFDYKDSFIFEMKLSQDKQNVHKSQKSSKVFQSQGLPELKKNLSGGAYSPSFSPYKRKVFTEKLWYCGKQVGEINGQLTFINLPILYQMKVGVLTKNGIFFSSRPFLLESQGLPNFKIQQAGESPARKI